MTKKQLPLILSLLCLVIVLPVSAQNEEAISALTPTLGLGRTAVREAGMRAYLRDDTSAINAVISFRAEHIYHTNYLTALRRYTNNGPVNLHSPRPWITQLVAGNRRPTLFPAHLRWEGRNDRHWRRTYHRARDVLRGDIEHQCRLPPEDDSEGEIATPHDWGSEHDSIRYRRNNPDAIELNCGQTCTLNHDGTQRMTRDGLARCNHFFHLPRYEERFGES